MIGVQPIVLKDVADVVQSGNEAAIIALPRRRVAVLKSDDFRAGGPQPFRDRRLHREVAQRNVTAMIRETAHQDRDFAIWGEDVSAVAEHRSQLTDESGKCRGIRQAPWVVVVSDHLPVRRVQPDEVEWLQPLVTVAVNGVESIADVTTDAGDAQFAADIAARSTAGHRIEYTIRLEVIQQVFDQISTTVATIPAVTVRTTLNRAVNAGQPRDRTGRLGSARHREKAMLMN